MTKFEEEVKRPKKAYIDPFSKREVDFTGVAKKFTEGAQTLKEWKEYAFLLEDKLKLQQQALPVVPECVGNFLTGKSIFGIANGDIPDYVISWVQGKTYYVDLEKIISHLISIKVTGYTVEKTQLFHIELPNVYGLSDSVFVSKVENGTILEFTKGKDYALALTEQEIKSIDERYWQFAVPVEDGE